MTTKEQLEHARNQSNFWKEQEANWYEEIRAAYLGEAAITTIEFYKRKLDQAVQRLRQWAKEEKRLQELLQHKSGKVVRMK